MRGQERGQQHVSVTIVEKLSGDETLRQILHVSDRHLLRATHTLLLLRRPCPVTHGALPAEPPTR